MRDPQMVQDEQTLVDQREALCREFLIKMVAIFSSYEHINKVKINYKKSFLDYCIICDKLTYIDGCRGKSNKGVEYRPSG